MLGIATGSLRGQQTTNKLLQFYRNIQSCEVMLGIAAGSLQAQQNTKLCHETIDYVRGENRDLRSY